MSDIYFTLVGTSYRYGHAFLEPGMEVSLVKEPDNPVDREAIQVTMPGIGHIGYVANTYRTCVGESYSAGRLYDKLPETATGTVVYCMERAVLCRLVWPYHQPPRDTLPE